MKLNEFQQKTLFRLIKRGSFNENGCFEWKGPCDNYGYGITTYVSLENKTRTWKVHRLIFHLLVHEVDPSMCVCHSCDNPKCFNVNHLFYGSTKDNNSDRASKNRSNSLKGETSKKHKLFEKDIHNILKMRKEGMSHEKLAEIFNVSKSVISRILNGKAWHHITKLGNGRKK